MKPLVLRMFSVVGLVVLVRLGVSIFSPRFSGNDLIMDRLITGFWHFLAANFPAISWNAGTWVPGLAAFLVATLFLHRWLSKWASLTGRPWALKTSFCLVLLVPVLFVISFIVPGMLLQWEALRETAWIEVR